MGVRILHFSLLVLILFSVIATPTDISSAQSVKDLVSLLAEAKTDQERDFLLETNKQLISKELRIALSSYADQIKIQGKYDQSVTLYLLAKRIAEQIGETEGIAYSLLGIGGVHFREGDYTQALEYFRQSLKLYEGLENEEWIAQTYRRIGIVYVWMADYSFAEDYLQKALAQFEDSNNVVGISQTLQPLGLLYEAQGRYSLALDCQERGFHLSQQSNDKEDMDATLNNIGNVYYDLGNYNRALLNYQKSLKIDEEISNKPGMGAKFENIGNVYFKQGNYAASIEYFEKAKSITDSLNEKGATADVLIEIGQVYSARGQSNLALEYFQNSLAINQEIGKKNGIAQAMNKIGETHFKQHEYERALDYYSKALERFEELGEKASIAYTFEKIALLHYSNRKHEQALDFAARAEAIAGEIGNPEILWEAQTTAGKCYFELKQFEQAQTTLGEAVKTVENLRTMVAGGEREKQQFFETRVTPYYALINLMIAQNRNDRALQYAEKAKSRVLLDVLESGKVDVDKSMTSDEKDNEERLRVLLVALNSQIHNENQKQKPDTKRVDELKLDLEKARGNFEGFEAGLYVAHPELKIFRGKSPDFNLTDAGNLFPENSAALLEFVVTDETTYLFVLTKEEDADSIQLKTYPVQIGRKELTDIIDHFGQQISNRDLNFQELATKLYNLLLKPAQPQLQKKTMLVIVPDGELWRVPFQALMVAPERFLIENFAISYSPSLTVLPEMQKLEKQDADLSFNFDFLAFGNPMIQHQMVAHVQDTHRDENLDPLPEAEREVKSLGKLYGKESKIFVGADAREDTLKAEASHSRILHLATHGIFDNTSPLYSHLVFSQSSEAPNEDGLLEAWEIVKMDLKANLAVLSACETARGQFGAGEGIIGLAWAFFVAGCPAVVVSQWKVGSASTSDLMLAFHKNLKESKLDAAHALQQAQLKLLHTEKYRHPFYWAPFVLIGSGSS